MVDQLTEKIIAAAIEVHKTLGSGLLESIYEEALCIELDSMGVFFQRQLAVDVLYKGHAIQGSSHCSGAILFESNRIKARIVTEFWREADDRRC